MQRRRGLPAVIWARGLFGVFIAMFLFGCDRCSRLNFRLSDCSVQFRKADDLFHLEAVVVFDRLSTNVFATPVSWPHGFHIVRTGESNLMIRSRDSGEWLFERTGPREFRVRLPTAFESPDGKLIGFVFRHPEDGVLHVELLERDCDSWFGGRVLADFTPALTVTNIYESLTWDGNDRFRLLCVEGVYEWRRAGASVNAEWVGPTRLGEDKRAGKEARP